jgi:hypothetical protein
VSRPSRIPVLIFDDDPRVIEDFRIVLDPPRGLGGGPDPMGIAFEAELIGSNSARGRFPEVDLTVERNGPAAVEAGRRAAARGQAFRIAFIDIGVPPEYWGLDTAAALRALDPKLHIVLTISEPGPSPLDLSERIAPADLLSLLRKPLHAPEIEQLILSAETRHLRETSEKLARSQACDIAAAAMRDLPIGLIVAEADRRIVVSTGAVSSIFPEYRGGLVPGTYLPEGLAWITQPNGMGPQTQETQRSNAVRELRLGDGRCVVAASARSADGGGMSLFLDVTDQRREAALRERHAQAVRLAENLTAFRRGVNVLLREYARPRGRAAANSRLNAGAGDRPFADQLQDLIAQFDVAVAAPVESDS